MPTRRGFFASLAALFVGARFWTPRRPPQSFVKLARATDAKIVQFDTLQGIAGEQLTAGEPIFITRGPHGYVFHKTR